jgi:RNA polymerase sigma-70 factor, ECF subfamily
VGRTMPVLHGDPEQSNVAENDRDEHEIALRSRHDPREFALLYTRYAAPIYRYCYRRLGARQPAEDATSLIFAKALHSLTGYRGPSFRAWLYGIAHHVVADTQRSRGSDASLDAATATIDASPSPEELAVASERRDHLHALLTHLSPEQQRIIELRLAGLTSAEIGEVLGLRRGTVDVAQFRAIARLRRLFGITVGTKEEHRG